MNKFMNKFKEIYYRIQVNSLDRRLEEVEGQRKKILYTTPFNEKKYNTAYINGRCLRSLKSYLEDKISTIKNAN